MKFGIIAAGEGSRLLQDGVDKPKPLVEINGEPLIDRLLRIFCNCGAEEICVVCNALTHQVSDHLEAMAIRGLENGKVPLRFEVKTTPSSMHTFAEISKMMGSDSKFIVTTVDTVFSEKRFVQYVDAFSSALASDEADGLMGVTQYIEDEKPLYVDIDESTLAIKGFSDNPSSSYISAGIYGLTSRSFPTLQRCLERGESRMRNFQRALIADGVRLRAFDMGKVIDIDHASDITRAEEMTR